MRVRSEVLVPGLAAGIVVAVFGLRGVSAQAGSEQDAGPIDDVRSQYEAAYNDRDASGVAALYEEGAVFLPDHEPIREGRVAIEEYYEGVFTQYTPRISITALETAIEGDLAHEHGTYSVTLRPTAGGPVLTEDGKYLVILNRQADGSWKIHHNINNTNTPSGIGPPRH